MLSRVAAITVIIAGATVLLLSEAAALFGMRYFLCGMADVVEKVLE